MQELQNNARCYPWYWSSHYTIIIAVNELRWRERAETARTNRVTRQHSSSNLVGEDARSTKSGKSVTYSHACKLTVVSYVDHWRKRFNGCITIFQIFRLYEYKFMIIVLVFTLDHQIEMSWSENPLFRVFKYSKAKMVSLQPWTTSK